MIAIAKDNEGTYSLSGLTADELEIIQEGILRLFAESKREEDRTFRRQVRILNKPIDKELDRIYADQVLQRNIRFGSPSIPGS
jgi:hypothetical protein